MTTHDSSPLATSSPWMETSTEDTMVTLWAPLLGFTDIASILWRGQLPQTPPGPIGEQAPTPIVGSTLVMSWMIQDAWGNVSVDMVTFQLNVVGMGATSMVTVSKMSPDLTKQSSTAKILSSVHAHITLS